MNIFRRRRKRKNDNFVAEIVGDSWTCHVCKDRRPDSRISVYSSTVMMGNIPVQQNVRYCNDRPDCVDGARSYNFIGTK